MPRLSVWFVRGGASSLCHRLHLRTLLLWNKALPLNAFTWRLLPAHMELLLVGWTVQLALGISFWILPRWHSQRGDVRPAWAAFFLLNLGVLIIVSSAFWPAPVWTTALGRTLELAAAAAFAVHAWPRVKPWVEGATG